MDVKTPPSIKILWISPNLNHYKQKFLNYFHSNYNIDLTILSGSGRSNMGDVKSNSSYDYKEIKVNVSKLKFGFSSVIRKNVKNIVKDFDWIMIPKEKKNIILIIYTFYLKKKYKQFKMCTYNHPIPQKGYGKYSLIEVIIGKLLYCFYDKVIFYSKKSRDEMVNRNFINSSKAYFANNTIFTKDIEENYNFSYPPENEINFLFIGRLIENKKIDILIKYYEKLKLKFNNLNIKTSLIVIGDGPEKYKVEDAMKKDISINWVGAIIDEKEISQYMKIAHLVFIPGHSGLSINHAFAYGRPYCTIKSEKHAPEINFLRDGYNGFILSGNIVDNIEKIYSFLASNDLDIYKNSYTIGKELSIENWCKQMEFCFD
jgi:glycosyltransferase involved in cell wall biosynthesis